MESQILLAAQHAAQGQIDDLFGVFYSSKDYFIGSEQYAPHSALSIALFLLPEYLDPALYAHRVYQLISEKDSTNYIERSFTDLEIPEENVSARAKSVARYIQYQGNVFGWKESGAGSPDLFSQWTQVRMKLIDGCGGQLSYYTVFNSIELVPYCEGVVKVVAKYREYSNSELSLAQFDKQSSTENVNMILQNTTIETIYRDFSELVIPYITYACSNDFTPLQTWISRIPNLDLLVPISSYPQVVSSVLQACYISTNTIGKWDILTEIYENIKNLDLPEASNSSAPPDLCSLADSFLITPPTTTAVHMFGKLAKYGELIAEKLPNVSLLDIVEVRFGSIEPQQNLARRYIFARTDKHRSFYEIEEELKLLQAESVFENITTDWINEQLLSASLQAGHFEFAKHIAGQVPYLKTLALESFETFFASASNGNRTRGNMKNASACIELLQNTPWAHDEQVVHAEYLIKALHGLSNYTITIKQGEPALPAEIRHMDPYEMIGLVLESNPQSYLEYDALVSIAEDFISGTGYVDKSSSDIDTTAVRIRAMCVDASLANNDFKSAYGYCIPVLCSLKDSQVAWTACFQVGKYVSAYWEDLPPATVVTDQMTILSYALQICPPENISTILDSWKRLESVRLESPQLSSTPASISSEVVSHDDVQGSMEARNSRKRDQISNLMVSGLAWAIGANQHQNQNRA